MLRWGDGSDNMTYANMRSQTPQGRFKYNMERWYIWSLCSGEIVYLYPWKWTTFPFKCLTLCRMLPSHGPVTLQKLCFSTGQILWRSVCPVIPGPKQSAVRTWQPKLTHIKKFPLSPDRLHRYPLSWVMLLFCWGASPQISHWAQIKTRLSIKLTKSTFSKKE